MINFCTHFIVFSLLACVNLSKFSIGVREFMIFSLYFLSMM